MSRPSSHRARSGLIVVFVLLLLGFAAGLWGTIIRPAAYEVRGEIVARATPGSLVVRHEAVSALGMAAMETMVIAADPTILDAARLVPGDRVQMAVRRAGDTLVLVWIRKTR